MIFTMLKTSEFERFFFLFKYLYQYSIIMIIVLNDIYTRTVADQKIPTAAYKTASLQIIN